MDVNSGHAFGILLAAVGALRPCGAPAPVNYFVRPFNHIPAASAIMYRYIHDASKQTVYRLPISPSIIRRTDKRGCHIDWFISMNIEITRADNKLTRNQWQHRVLDPVSQSLRPEYSEEQAISYFKMHHTPDGEEISEEEYTQLQAQYEQAARSN